MKTRDIIRTFACSQPGKEFTRKALLTWVQSSGLSANGSEKGISLALNRMFRDGELKKVSWGRYALAINQKRLFLAVPDGEIRSISKLLKSEFPYTAHCVWNPQIIVPFMQHIPNLLVLIVEVERVAMEPVFNLLQEKVKGRRVVYNPSADDYAHYVSGYPSIIVKPLVSRAPMMDVGGVNQPSLEKLMVDIAGDIDFGYAQGAELFTIFANIVSAYEVNLKALYRYADRRNRRPTIENLIKSSEL